jgi:hypothetical protein
MARDYAAIIGSLLAKAESTEHDAEAATYRAKAEEMMREYRVSEEEALAIDPAAVSPVSRKITVRQAGRGQGDLAGWYGAIFGLIARHTGVRYHVQVSDDWSHVATVVGYEGDVRYTEFLWTAAYLMFATRIDPTWDTNRSEDDNIFFLRDSGIERRKIADMAWGNGDDAAARSKVQRIYVREAARRNEPVRAAGLGFDASTYRGAYADGFQMKLASRLRAARDAADSVGGGVVLHGRSDRVDEAFYTLFPNLRPDTLPVVFGPDPEPCPKCAKAKSGACRDHPVYTWTKADQARADRRTYSASARGGRESGAAAAEGVTIARGHDKANRLDRANGALES